MAILQYPLRTEKAIRAIETENKITFVVTRSAKKPEIAKEIMEMFKTKVANVNVLIKRNRKIAIIKLKPETPALDIATKLGMI